MARGEWLVAGRVQGVAFRASTRRQALGLGLAGVAENLADGRVRVVGVGDAAALERLEAWLRHGPPGARVDRLSPVPGPDGEDEEDGEDGDVTAGFVTR